MKKCFQLVAAALLIISSIYVMQLGVINSEVNPIKIDSPLILDYEREQIEYKNDKHKYMHTITHKYNARINKIKINEEISSKFTSSNQDLETYQDDKALIQRVRKIIDPPSQKPYNLTLQVLDTSFGQSKLIRNILGNIRGGFFVECGAWEGELKSNTLMLERDFGWRGLLIEADLGSYELVLGKNRKAWSINRCLSLKPHPTKVIFEQNMSIGRIVQSTSGGYPPWQREVECLPLYSLMLALNVTTIDYFSLDIEGDELAVLRTIPWDKLNIRTLSVESFHREISKQIIKYMNGNGYKLYITFLHPDGHDQDLIFYKNDVIPKKPATSIKWFPKYYATPEKPGCKKHVYTYKETMISPS